MKDRIRILFTMPNFDKAGSGKVVYDLINGLDKERFDIELTCNHKRGAFFKEVEKLGFPIHIYKTAINYKPYLTLPGRIWTISRFFKNNKYDIIHSWHWSSDWTEVIAARMAGSKWLYTKKAMSWGNRHWKIRSYLAHFIVNINHEMEAYYPKKRAQKLIPLGIDTDYYSPSHFERKSSTEVFHIITVANLVPVKGIEILLEAVNMLKGNDWKLTILGNKDNDYGREMEALSQSLGLSDKVSFLGKHPDVRPFISDADLYIIPTLDQGRKEGMPMALVEAMSMAIPVLGSDISGINYVLKDFPQWLVPAGNEQALADAISKLKQSSAEKRSDIGNELRNYCLKHFTMTQFIEAHEELYTQLA
ncbi:MAG: glycosyltransferase [Bacteroidia bacterium]|nr:glycosyltransferase [Bacteroidia bacterium]NNE16461.1 glycosyltransferase [Saprospiraceae bacterium]